MASQNLKTLYIKGHYQESKNAKKMGESYLFPWAPKWLKMGTTAMKLKDACSSEDKL